MKSSIKSILPDTASKGGNQTALIVGLIVLGVAAYLYYDKVYLPNQTKNKNG